MAIKDNENLWGKVPKKRRTGPSVAAAEEGIQFPRKYDVAKLEAPTRSWPYVQAPYLGEDSMAKFNILLEVAGECLRALEEPPKEERNVKRRAEPARAKKKRAPIVAELPEALKAKLVEAGGEGFRIVMDKLLTQTDVREYHYRLSLPTKWLVESELDELLTPSEKASLKALRKVEVEVADSDVVLQPGLQLKIWMMENTKVLNLAGKKWIDICESHSLQKDHFVQLWGFRIPKDNNKLAFAIVNLGFRPAPLI